MPPQRRSKGKKKQPSPGSRKLRFPDKRDNEQLGRVVEILGNDHMRVQCEDGKTRLGRIRGKIKKRMWIRLGEIVIIQPWDWETANTAEGDGETLPKCDIIWRYQLTQTKQLFRRGILPQNLAEAMNLTEEDLVEEGPGPEAEKPEQKPEEKSPENPEPGTDKE
jgi:translation initiation factor 1A